MKTPRQIQAENQLRNAIKRVQAIMPKGMGVAIFVFERDTAKGNMGYISNAERQGMRRALAEFLDKWDADAAGAPFLPLTLDAFEAWVMAQRDEVTRAPASIPAALARYRELSNASGILPEEVETKHEQ